VRGAVHSQRCAVPNVLILRANPVRFRRAEHTSHRVRTVRPSHRPRARHSAAFRTSLHPLRAGIQGVSRMARRESCQGLHPAIQVPCRRSYPLRSYPLRERRLKDESHKELLKKPNGESLDRLRCAKILPSSTFRGDQKVEHRAAGSGLTILSSAKSGLDLLELNNTGSITGQRQSYHD
jgi:hypothetical protein